MLYFSVQRTGPHMSRGAQLFKCFRSFSSHPPNLDPNKDSRRQKLTIATYMSGLIGAFLLTAVGFRYYGKMKRRAAGMEEIKVSAYSFGRRPWLYSYRGYNIPELIVRGMRDVHVFEVREDDVWVITYPKAGTTWLQEIVYLVMNDADTGKASKIDIDDRFPYFEYKVPGFKAISRMPSPRLIKSHLPLSLLPNQMKSKKPKMIYLARNPKDTLISLYTFTTKFLSHVPFTGNFEDYCQLFASDKVMYGPWWKHVSEAWSRKDEDNILVLFYEDLQEDSIKAVREVAQFLGKPLSNQKVEEIAEHCSFDKMKNNDKVNHEWMKKAGFAKEGQSFMRKGKVGDWKEHLSSEVVKQLDEMVATKLPPEVPIRDTLNEH